MAASDKNLKPEDEELASDWLDPSDQEAEAELAIGNRVGNWKTIVSFAFALVVFAVAIYKGGFDPHAIWNRVKHLNILIFLSAFVVYYATFPIRGYRWKVLLQNAYRGTHAEAVDEMTVVGLSEIIYISWFVNCVVPAKLGDLYRAYLAKLWVHISWTKTIGTVLAERIIDILVLGLFMAATGFVVFHNRLGGVSKILLLGVALAVVGIVMVIVMKTFSEHIRRIVPARFHAKYVSFEEGALQSFRRIPLLLGATMLIWLLEGSRFQLVFTSLGLSTNHISSIPFAPVLFFALGTAVLTTIPFTPGGLGLVEAGLVGMMIYLGVHKADAAAVVLVDRILSYYSVAFFGFIVYLLSKRSHFRHPV